LRAALQLGVISDHVLIAWETVSDLDNRGFHLYRVEKEEGPWMQLNLALIPGRTTGFPQGQTYRWKDRNVSRGAVCYVNS
jgi:hypothetical protein